jgi:hypothetical protein
VPDTNLEQTDDVSLCLIERTKIVTSHENPLNFENTDVTVTEDPVPNDTDVLNALLQEERDREDRTVNDADVPRYLRNRGGS